MDIENKLPDVDLPQPSFNRRRFYATLIFSVFAQLASECFGPLYPEDETVPTLLGIVSLSVPVLFTISLGFQVGFKPVVISGFFTMAFWPVIVGLSIVLESKSLRKLAIVLQPMSSCVLFGSYYIIVFHFKHYGKMRLIGAIMALLVFGGFVNITVPLLLPSTWLPAVYGLYCFAMIIAVYLNVPNTAYIMENVSLLDLLPILIGFAGYLMDFFIWLQFRTAFHSQVASVLFLAICVSAGALTGGLMLCGWPIRWKQTRAERMLLQETMRDWYRVG